MSEQLDQLKQQAEGLGIEVDGRWGEDRLREEIDKALEGPEDEAKDGAEPESESEDEPEPEQQDAPAPEPESEPATDSVVVRNAMRGPQKIGAHMVPADGTVEITRTEQTEKLMRKIKHGLKVGSMSKV